MKKFRKVLSVVGAVALATCMGTTAFAEDVTSMPGEQGSNVTLNATGITPENSYSVNITFNNLTFRYTGTAATGWNPSEHDYDTPAVPGTWENDGTGTVVVTNHSNAPVTLSGEYSSSSGYDTGSENPETGVTVTFTPFDVGTLQAGNEGNIAGSDGDNQDTASVKVSGTPKMDLEEVVAGTITVRLAAVDE